MRKLFIFVILFCTNFSTKAQSNSLDSMTTEVIEYIEFKTQKKFFSYPNDSLDTLETTMIFFNQIDSNLAYIFSVKKVNEIFILISINERKNKKNHGSYLFEKNNFSYKKDDFLVEINQQHFLEKMEVFFSFVKGQIDR